MKKIINIWPEISETTCKGIKPKKKKKDKSLVLKVINLWKD